MDISTIASIASASAAATLKNQVSIVVLKKAVELEQTSVAQLLQVLPPPTLGAARPGASGRIVDTFA